MSHRILIYTLGALLLSGCAWFGGDDCDGPNCEGPQLLDNSANSTTWYCYGTPDETWDCGNNKSPGKIVAVRPAPPGERATPLPNPPAAPQVEQKQLTLLDQPADAFAVQLIALRDREGVAQYARANGVGEPIVARVLIDGAAWYLLLLGVYADQAAAEAAMGAWALTRTLPVEPWVRRLGPLQEAIRIAGVED